MTPMAVTRCTTCGSQLATRGVCQNCGTLVGVELAVARARQRVHGIAMLGAARVPRRLQTHHLLWLCALIPLAIVPPVLSLVASIALMGRGGQRTSDLEWIATVSMLNILLSGLILYRFHFSPGELFAYLANGLLGQLWELVPPAPRRPPAQLMPV